MVVSPRDFAFTFDIGLPFQKLFLHWRVVDVTNELFLQKTFNKVFANFNNGVRLQPIVQKSERL
jgi:hypothetical protein